MANQEQTQGPVQRQYRLFTKVVHPGEPQREFTRVEPGVHRALYDRPSVKQAEKLLSYHPEIVGLAIRDGDRLFNLVAFEQPGLSPTAFKLEDRP